MSLWLRKRVKKHGSDMTTKEDGVGFVYISPPATILDSLLARLSLFFLFFTTLLYVVLVPVLVYYAWYSWWVALLLGTLLSTPLWTWVPPSTSRGWKAFGQTAGFSSWRRYFEFSVYKEERIPQARNVMMAIAPHGLFPLMLPMMHGVCDEVFPEFEGHIPNTAIADAMFYAPVISPLLRWLHCVSATKEGISRALQTNNCVILPDGIAGAFHSRRDKEQVYIENRHGFIKQAMAQGSMLVPGYCFGHTQLFDVYPSAESLIAALSRRLQFSLVFFIGERWLPPLPRRTPLLLVFGKGIKVEQNANPSPMEVKQVHARYKAALSDLYYEHRNKVPGYEDKELVFVYSLSVQMMRIADMAVASKWRKSVVSSPASLHFMTYCIKSPSSWRASSIPLRPSLDMSGCPYLALPNASR